MIVDESHLFFRNELRKVLQEPKYANATFGFIDDIR
jgi:hypothetical protein